jgi:uncharacterized protein YceK
MKRLVYVLLVALLFTGCATMFTGTQTPVNVTATPATASVVIKAQTGQVYYQGEAPAVVKLDKKNTYQVEITLTGYKTQIVMISQTVTGWFWGNLCTSLFVGWAIDFITGGMWDLNPSTIDVKLAVALNQGSSIPGIVFYTRDDEGQLRYLVMA